MENDPVTADQGGPTLRIFSAEDFRRLLAWEVQRATRYQDFLSLCLVRPDHPPNPNILDAVARRVAELLRATDLVGLLDDTIAILLVHTPDSDAATVTERLRDRVEAHVFSAAPGAPAVTPALSLGLASFPTDATSDGALFAQAHARLAEAGRGGSRSSQSS